MKKPLILIALIFLLVGVVVNISEQTRLNRAEPESYVLSDDTIQKTATPTVSENDSSSVLSPTSTPETSEAATITKTYDKTAVSSVDISSLIYPGSDIVSQSSNELNLQSSANDSEVTNWYKAKIKNLGFNVTSFVTTTANGSVLNKLAASNSTSEISVEIHKDASSSLVQIIVSLGVKNF